MTSDSSVWAPRKPNNLSNLEMSHCEVDNQIIFCVRGLGNGEHFTEEERRIQEDVFKKLTIAGIEPVWITAEECMRVSKNDPNFYVFPCFRGSSFNHLDTQKVKIIGASLVCQCLTEGKSLPKWSHPVFSLNLSGAVICFTGINAEKRKLLSDLVRWMNGIVSGSFTTSVTHLITEKCVSSAPKYKVSRQIRVPVMSPTWIEHGWERAKKLVVEDLLSAEIVQNNVLPIFSKLVICTSGISGQDRSDMGRLIELHGGKNPGDMTRKECTHLIIDGTTGPKYRKAREWGSIEIVESRWLRKCVEEGYLLSEKQFDPATPHLRSSTQAPNGKAPPAELEFSSIMGSAKVPITSQSFNVSVEQRDRVDKTNTPATATRPKFARNQSNRQMNTTNSFDPIDNLPEMSYRGDFDFLEGCLIWLCGVDESRIEKWKRVLDRCGATRVTKPENATHIIVLNATEEKKTLMEVQRRGVVIIRPDWIIECVHKKDIIPVDEFIWTNDNSVSRISNTISMVSTSSSSKTVPVPLVTITNTTASYDIVEVPREEPVLSAAGPSIPTVPLFDKGQTRVEAANLSFNTSFEQEDTKDTFRGITFRIHNLDEETKEFWHSECNRHKGRILRQDDQIMADYLITTQVEYSTLPTPLEARYKHVATDTWLKCCVLKSSLVDVNSHPLFRPIPAVEGSSVFEGIVVGFLGLEPFEKNSFIDLIQTFGGRVESSIVSKPRNGVLPCTHLIPSALNQKITECCRKLPRLKIVDPSWVIESVINDKVLAEEQFPLESAAFSSYTGRTDDLWVEKSVSVANELDEPPSSNMTIDQIDDFLLGTDGPSSTRPIFQNHSNFSQIRRNSDARRLQPTGDSDFTDPSTVNLKLQLNGLTQIIDGISSPAASFNDSTINSSLSVSRVGKVLAEAAIKTERAPVQKSKSDEVVRPVHQPSLEYSKSDNSGYLTRSRRSLDKQNPSTSKSSPISINTDDEASAASRRLVEQQIAQLKNLKEAQERDSVVSQPAQVGAGKRRRCFEVTESPHAKRSLRQSQEAIIEWQPVQTEYAAATEQDQRGYSRSQSNTTPVKGTIRSNVTEKSHESRGEQELVQTTLSSRKTSFQNSSVQSDRRQNSVNQNNTPIKGMNSVQNSSSLVRGSLRNTSFENSISARETVRNASIPHSDSGKLTSEARVLSERNYRPKTQPKVFIFTSISSAEEKSRLAGLINSLGGIANVTEKSDLTDDMTHLICGKLVRGTKLMGFIASGKWVLTVDYVEKSAEAGKWLKEEDYEWSNPPILTKYKVQGRELQIAIASRRWRLRLEDSKKEHKANTAIGAFTGWKFVLYASKEKAAGLVPLMEAGKATVAVRDQISSLDSYMPTHAICCSSNGWNERELRELVQLNAKVFTLDYISKYLLEENVSESECYHPDFRALIRFGH